MIDYGLAVSMIIAFGLPAIAGSWWTISGRDSKVAFVDVALGPAFIGLLVGRLTTLALDDPSSMGSVADMVIIRSGVEFWPGVAATTAAVLGSAKFERVPPTKRMAELAPLAMLGYAGYEAACIFRDGCFGPASAIGLRPPGLATTMIPVGWIMAVAVGLAAVGVRRLVSRGQSSLVVALVAAAAVSSVRAIGSIWLPHVGDGPTRQHLTSLAVAVVSLVALAATVGMKRWSHGAGA